MPNESATAKTMKLERTFDATARELWDAWTDPEQYAKWLNPAPGHDLVIHEWDLRPGGAVRFDMPQPDGNLNPQTGVFHELEPEKRLVSGEPDKSFLLEATFHPEADGRTRLVVQITGIPPEYREPAVVGWNQCFDKLEIVLGRVQGALVITRVLDASARDVWDAWTDPEQFKKWWGPPGFTAPASNIDARIGGRYLHAMRSPDGKEMWTTGEFQEIDAPRRLVMTHVLADENGKEVPHPGMDAPLQMRLVVTLVEHDDTTIMTLQHHGMPSDEARQGAGMGWEGAFDKMQALVQGA